MFKILIVDDEPAWITQMQWMARGEEREVVTAEGSDRAIQLIQQHDFDVVVTDLRMETKEAGLDVLKATKIKNIYTQVIVVTAYATPEIDTKTKHWGAFDFVDRCALGIDFVATMRSKITSALEFRQAQSDAIIGT